MLDAYATHVPVLAAAIAAAGPGPVLELGAGNFSTPVLHAMCAAMGRSLLTLENNPTWLERFVSFRSTTHRVEFVADWDQAVPADRWAVVFVDHAPGERRIIDIEKLREMCEVMVVHDTEDVGYGYGPAFSKFTYRTDYKRMTPWTTMLSMTRDVSLLGDL